MSAFKYNPNAKPQPGQQQAATPLAVAGGISEGRIQVQTAEPSWFGVTYPDVYERYKLPGVNTDSLVQAWNANPMGWWQNQLNFAVWIATTGCGVGTEHFNHQDPLLRALYRFHMYYQIRRVLTEIQAALPRDQSWSATGNAYDKRAYERISNEFDVSPHTDWRVKGPNNGLGRVYFYATGRGYVPVYGAASADDYDPAKMSFTETTSRHRVHVDFSKTQDFSKTRRDRIQRGGRS